MLTKIFWLQHSVLCIFRIVIHSQIKFGECMAV